jgi:hypothetical protein
MSETITTLTGNQQPITRPLPRLYWLTGEINDVAIQHIFANTGLTFTRVGGGYEAYAERSSQVIALLMTYNFKTRYFDNANEANTLMLKNDHHVGFDVDSICVACCDANNIHHDGMAADARLAC